VTVRSSLPAHAQWVGSVSPSTENVTYNELTNTIEWKVPRIEAGAGVTKPAKEVAFQVGIIPSTSQIGNPIEIISNYYLKGTDEFTTREVDLDYAYINTILHNDAYFGVDEGQVAP
jgi:hypothetical protein